MTRPLIGGTERIAAIAEKDPQLAVAAAKRQLVDALSEAGYLDEAQRYQDELLAELEAELYGLPPTSNGGTQP